MSLLPERMARQVLCLNFSSVFHTSASAGAGRGVAAQVCFPEPGGTCWCSQLCLFHTEIVARQREGTHAIDQ